MNIFYLSRNPRRAARYHCDRHVVKMILESTQLLWTAWWVLAPPEMMGPTGSLVPYRPTHRNHPCAVWVRASVANYRWLVALAQALADEYRFRYGAHKVHACEAHIAWLAAHEPPSIPAIPRTPVALAMPDEFKRTSARASYRAYYCGAKTHLLAYTGRRVPAWVRAMRRAPV